ncbi:NACHT domain-containing protein [Rhizobium sp. PP-F2F-G38]|nr:NACHT domain-containing protein [Rhizobium sp. PP-WC-1G-195]PYF00663.1 NACHT domain-containing protein [Rhizobium sp. PP-F2F-G38]
MGLIETIAINGFAGMLSNLASNYIERNTKSLDVPATDLKTNLKNHFGVIFEKCTKIKTIISDKPTDFLSIYINQKFSSSENIIDQFDLIESIRRNNSYVISGTGGGGKSMFMRYLWLSYFEKSDGKIPFFLELRQLNNLTHTKLEDFIYHSIIQTRSTISQKNFDAAIHQGEFVLFFDGFDELNLDIRDKVEQWIIQIKENNPKLTIIVSSRPMERFRGWAGFSSVSVMPLDKKQVIELIDRAPFFDEDKRKFKKKIDDGLYESHSEFLSNPLLSYMMLVTISYNPDIPMTMHLFYEMAFEALYYRHDLTKNGYRRQFESNLDKQTLIRILSYFSLISYYEQEYEFDEGKYLSICAKIRKAENINFDDMCVLRDLIDCLCLIKKEGIEYSFTHRSLQEYFAAYCIARVTSKNIEKIFGVLANRSSDQVMLMVYQINPFLFREKYLSVMHEKYKKIFFDIDPEPRALLFHELTEGKFQYISRARTVEAGGRRRDEKRPEKRDYSIFYEASGELYSLLSVCIKISGLKIKNKNTDDEENRKRRQRVIQDERFITSMTRNIKVRVRHAGSITAKNGIVYTSSDEDKSVIAADNSAFARFKLTGMYAFLFDNNQMLKDFIEGEMLQYRQLSEAFDELF